MSSPTTVTTTETKRRSFNVGPRALHLLEGTAISPTTLTRSPTETEPLSSARSLNEGSHPHIPPPPHPVRRRPSSISYKSPVTTTGNNLEPLRLSGRRSPFAPRHGNTPAQQQSSRTVLRDTQPTTTTTTTANTNVVERPPPLTLAEKHAELLHFIAQKESKCLELRTQLAVHEAELLQLKRKWERIVSRRYGAADDSASTTSGSVVLEGIKEGVQGVSKFFTAGLGDFSSSSPSGSGTPSRTRSNTTTQNRHSTRPSVSSDSTSSGTGSTRLSQSSVSSLTEEEEENTSPSREKDNQVLIVHDTGATPTVSPNLAFVRQQNRQRQKGEEKNSKAPSSSKEEIGTTASDDSHVMSTLHVIAGPENHTLPCPSSVVTRSTGANTLGKPKVATAHTADFPTIPGIGTLAAVGMTVPPMSSWVGSVGKKWEELQRNSSLSKSQKRASVLLSDVSQSIVSAFSSPILSPLQSTTTTVQNDLLPLNASLLDDDDDDDDDTLTGPSISVLIPDAHPTSTRIAPTREDEDEEWNW